MASVALKVELPPVWYQECIYSESEPRAIVAFGSKFETRSQTLSRAEGETEILGSLSFQI